MLNSAIVKPKNNDPLSPINYIFYGVYHYSVGHYNEALELVSKADQMAPEYTWSKFWLANVYAAKNELDKAIKTIDQTLGIEGIEQFIEELLQFLKYVLRPHLRMLNFWIELNPLIHKHEERP